MSLLELEKLMLNTYRLSETHQPIERHSSRGELWAFDVGNSKSVALHGKTGDGDIILHNCSGHIASSISNGKWFTAVVERAAGFWTKEFVISLQWNCLISSSKDNTWSETHATTSICGSTVL